jgi:hypothetical protein
MLRPAPARLLSDLRLTLQRLRRLTVARSRLDAARARSDSRDWAKARRARTRHLIELGGLVTKAGLVELLDDDRATLLGALLELAGRLRGAVDEDPAHLRARWRRHGLRAFAADREGTVAREANVARDGTVPGEATVAREAAAASAGTEGSAGHGDSGTAGSVAP